MNSKITIDTISKIPFFYDMSKDDLLILIDYLTIRNLEAPRYVFKEGDLADSMYFVLSGKVKIVKKVLPDNEETLSEVHPMQFFGEMSFIDGRRRQAGAVTLSEFCALKLSIEEFDKLQIEHPQIAINIIRKTAHTLGLKLRKFSNNREGII